jgi:hypothetical protein
MKTFSKSLAGKVFIGKKKKSKRPPKGAKPYRGQGRK